MARFFSTSTRKTISRRSCGCWPQQQQNQLSDTSAQAELLLGGLYLSYGHHLEAAEIFERLLADNVDPEIRDRTWFFLAKIWKQRGYLDKAQHALTTSATNCPKISGARPGCCRRSS